MPPGTLHSARRVQFRKESNQHAQSLPCAKSVGKFSGTSSFSIANRSSCSRIPRSNANLAREKTHARPSPATTIFSGSFVAISCSYRFSLVAGTYPETTPPRRFSRGSVRCGQPSNSDAAFARNYHPALQSRWRPLPASGRLWPVRRFSRTIPRCVLCRCA